MRKSPGHNDTNANDSHLDMVFRQLKLGDKAVIKSVKACSQAYRRRLIAMGLIPGVMIRIKKIAPFGDPLVIETNGLTIALRRQEAALLDIEPA